MFQVRDDDKLNYECDNRNGKTYSDYWDDQGINPYYLHIREELMSKMSKNTIRFLVCVIIGTILRCRHIRLGDNIMSLI